MLHLPGLRKTSVAGRRSMVSSRPTARADDGVLPRVAWRVRFRRVRAILVAVHSGEYSNFAQIDMFAYCWIYSDASQIDRQHRARDAAPRTLEEVEGGA